MFENEFKKKDKSPKMKKILFVFILISILGCKSTGPTANTISDELTSPILDDHSDIETRMVAALKWQEANPIHSQSPTDWTNGAYYTGVVKAHEATQNRAFSKALWEMADRADWQPWNRTYHADDVVISYAYVYLNSLDASRTNLDPTVDFLRTHLFEPNQWSEGSDPSGFKNILWWWCDALFMAPPVIVEYAVMTGEHSWMDRMHHFYKETYDLLFDQEEKLFARDTRFQWTDSDKDLKEANGRKIFWSRGNGWVLGGLALILDSMPEDYKHRPFYVDLYITMAKKIKEIQPEEGLWRTSLLNPDKDNHGEVSGSGFYTFALAWGINNGLLSKSEYLPAVEKAWKGLQSCQKPNGKIGWVQNIGASPEPASSDSWQNFGTGAFLLAGSEILKIQS